MIAARSEHTSTKRRVIVASDPVSTIMTRVAVEVSEDMTLDTLRSVFLETRADALPVVDRARSLVGLVILRDLVAIGRATEPPDALRARLVRDVTRPIKANVHEYSSIRRAARIMVAEQVSRLPVIDRAGRLAGIVSAIDVLQRVVPVGEGVFS